MEEKKAYGLVMTFVAVFVVFLASVMSYSLWRDKQINAFMATNRAWGIQCDRSSQAAGNDSNLLIVFYVQIMPDDFVMQLHRF